MFNFYVVFAGHDMVTNAGRATTTTRRCKIKPHDYKQKYKKKDHPKTWISTGKPFEVSGKNKNKTHF